MSAKQENYADHEKALKQMLQDSVKRIFSKESRFSTLRKKVSESSLVKRLSRPSLPSLDGQEKLLQEDPQRKLLEKSFIIFEEKFKLLSSVTDQKAAQGALFRFLDSKIDECLKLVGNNILDPRFQTFTQFISDVIESTEKTILATVQASETLREDLVTKFHTVFSNENSTKEELDSAAKLLEESKPRLTPEDLVVVTNALKKMQTNTKSGTASYTIEQMISDSLYVQLIDCPPNPSALKKAQAATKEHVKKYQAEIEATKKEKRDSQLLVQFSDHPDAETMRDILATQRKLKYTQSAPDGLPSLEPEKSSPPPLSPRRASAPVFPPRGLKVGGKVQDYKQQNLEDKFNHESEA